MVELGETKRDDSHHLDKNEMITKDDITKSTRIVRISINQ